MQAPSQQSRKERERQARKTEILDAARTVFSERGFEKATLDEIAARAELGKGTIYNYFNSKEALFASVIVRGIKRFQAYVLAAVQDSSDPRTKIEAYIDASFTFFGKHRSLFSIFEFEKSALARSLGEDLTAAFCENEMDIVQVLEQLFHEGVRSGDFKNLDTQRMAETVFGMIHVGTVQAIRHPESHNLTEQAQFIKSLVFDGLATLKNTNNENRTD